MSSECSTSRQVEQSLDFCQARAVKREAERSVRRPVQERSRQRREALLDATARLLDSHGWDALTTNAVAREAGASVGALYEYFPHREALLAGLLARHGERLGAAVDEALAQAQGDLGRGADAVVTAFARVWASEPGYRAAWLGAQSSPVLAETGAAWSRAFTQRVAHALAPFLPHAKRRDVTIVASTAVHLVSGLLLAAMTGPPAHRSGLVRETQVALRAYLAARLPGGASATLAGLPPSPTPRRDR
jgi:AcrR family transcriptional regulator